MINLYLALALTVILYHTVRIKLLSGISNLESNIMILLKSFSLSCLGLYTSVLLFRVFMYVAVLVIEVYQCMLWIFYISLFIDSAYQSWKCGSFAEEFGNKRFNTL